MEEITKTRVRELVETNDMKKLLALFDEDPSRVRRFLTRLAFNPDDAHHGQTIACFQMLSRERSGDAPGFFSEIIRRSLWEMNEEGGNIPWSAPEIIGAVVAGNPEQYGKNFSYAFCAAVDEPTFQPSLVRAFDLVAAKNPELVAEFRDAIDQLRA